MVIAMIELPMKAFCLPGSDGDDKIEMTINEVFGFPETTSYTGGYEFKGVLAIQAGSYSVCSEDFYSTTGELYNLYASFTKCYDSLEGMVIFPSACYERAFEFELEMIDRGRGMVKGRFTEYSHLSNSLIFEIEIDQSCIRCAIDDLKQIEMLFGDNKGKRTK